MPKVPGNPKKAGSELVRCRCKARCLKLNKNTGKYEGKGQDITSKARAIHRRDQRLLDALQLGEEGEATQVIAQQDAIEDDDLDRQELWGKLIEAHLDLMEQLPVVHAGGNHQFRFVNDPKETGGYEFEYMEAEGGYDPLPGSLPNTGSHSLEHGRPENRHYIERENALWEVCRTLETFVETDLTHQLRRKAFQQLCALELEKAIGWESQRNGQATGPYFNTDVFFQRNRPQTRQVKIAALTSLVLQFKYFLPRRGAEIYLSGTSDLLSANPRGPLGDTSFPRDPRPFPARFNLDPITSSYISCVKCHCLYPYALDRDTIPQRCTFQRTPTSLPCNADLWKRISRGPLPEVTAPIRQYLHQGMKPWLGRLLSRPGMEKLLHDYPRSLCTDEANGESPEIRDIWQGEVFREIKDPDGRPFFPGPQGDLRLAFSMSVDGFQTFQMKTAKQSSSSTGIWLVLLNLPWHLRYLPQNMYLAGVIPGPQKPSNDEINHYVKLVVNDLKDLWRPGVRFSRTYDCPHGRNCKGLLIPVICDLLGAHQLVGYPGSPNAHYFCTCCELDIDDISVVDPSEWPKKDIRHIRRYAQLYRDANSETHQQLIFEACGWRWSPLFELEYWDPSLFTVIDSMHSLDLNVLKNHVRELFQINIHGRRGDALRTPAGERTKRVLARTNEISALMACQDLIYENPPKLLYELLKVHRKVLYSFCLDYDIRGCDRVSVTGTRWILAKAIHRWRQNRRSGSLQAFLDRYPLLSEEQQTLVESGSPEPGRSSRKGKERAENQGLGQDESQPTSDDGAARMAIPRVEEGRGDEEDPGDGIHESPEVLGEEGSVHPVRANVAALRRAARRIVALAEDYTEERSETVYSGITIAILQEFCEALELEPPEATQGPSRRPKRPLFDYVVAQLISNPPMRDNLKEKFGDPEPEISASAAFLGKEVMEAIWNDMTLTRLPSWVTPAPRDWGTTRRGKLSADNWRVICCIHLPITLIRLFGSVEGRPRQLLDNFMQLISAVRIATMTTSSKAHVQAYNAQIFAYARGVMDLYPDYTPLPSLHASLHIGDMLRRFGPKHSHDSPHYERYIHFFHRMNTNHKLGEVEATFLRTAVRNANLLSLLSDSLEEQTLVSDILNTMSKHDKERTRGFRLAESLDPLSLLDPSMTSTTQLDGLYLRSGEISQLSDSQYAGICRLVRGHPLDDAMQPVSRNAAFVQAVSYRNCVYAVWESTKHKDSNILFQIRPNHQERAGIVRRIFLHRQRMQDGHLRTDAYLEVAVYEETGIDDPFRRYGHAGGFCCKRNPSSTCILALESVMCHVAVTEFDEEGVVHILPINRELLSLEMKHLENNPVEEA